MRHPSKAGQLSGQVQTEIVRKRIAALVREMNSFYSNLIELFPHLYPPQQPAFGHYAGKGVTAKGVRKGVNPRSDPSQTLG